MKTMLSHAEADAIRLEVSARVQKARPDIDVSICVNRKPLADGSIDVVIQTPQGLHYAAL